MNDPKPSPAPPKKEYRAPKLTVYGSLRELTGSKSSGPAMDSSQVFLMNFTN